MFWQVAKSSSLVPLCCFEKQKTSSLLPYCVPNKHLALCPEKVNKHGNEICFSSAISFFLFFLQNLVTGAREVYAVKSAANSLIYNVLN